MKQRTFCPQSIPSLLPDGTCDCDGTLPEENFDCDGNCTAGVDCAGVCGGSSVEDECGVCDGPGADVECWDGSMVCDVSDCDDEPGETSISFGVVADGTLEVLMSNDSPVAGFQFDVDGVTVTGAGGGAAEEAGFTVSNSETTVIGFSLTGSTIPAGTGVLVVLEVTGSADDACLSGLVISDSDGQAVDVLVEDCTSIVEDVDCLL